MTTDSFAAELARFGPASSVPALSKEAALAYCRRLARAHYENFSVVSWLVPRRFRQHFCNVYAYCRWADDLADEVPDATRSLELLAWWQEQLDACFDGRARHPVFVALAETIRECQLPHQPLDDLLRAFRRDQRQHRYETVDELLDYCRYSANPVGRLVLHFAGCDDSDCRPWSDAICSGLQWANFCQDVARDFQRGRIYLPQESFRNYGYDEACFEQALVNDAWRGLLATEVERAESMLLAGEPLMTRMPAEFRLQTELFQRGGRAILREIRRSRYDVWSRRPTVGRRTKGVQFLQAWMAAWRR